MIPLDDLLVVLAIAGAAALAAALAGAAALAAVRRRSIAVGLTVLVLTVVGAGASATSATGLAMFLSVHDLRVLLVVVAVAAVVGTAGALLLARRLVAGVRDVAAVARSLADEGPVAVPDRALPAELAALASDLVTAAERLAVARARERSLEGSRRELVGWVSHDLRTPLAGLRAMAEALEDGVVDEPSEVAAYHRRMRVETDRLTAMVDDLFELSRLHAGTLRLIPVPTVVADLVSDAVAAARPVARARGVHLVGRGDPDVACLLSAVSLSRVVSNLVSNAVRHTPAGGTVTVTCGRADGNVWVVVSDECGGIPEVDVPRVFDVGFQGSRARSPRDGAGGGLGLSIARGLVEAAGGRVEVANRDGGCCFTVRLTAPRSVPTD
ncbi:Signal transduction histidine kinase [Modestobacter sp. DSM 44400]|uniref:sensor histidine kinase n=1 Tax=Modestobacter sp. DSM 44400 TaxID=1550230 RepID=UPI000896A24B|nr:HAMP domain-containing sensor histidine kinase [Modestobacter sp. DSM 44400]SDY34515.1 Signal transduction histidine kinase [Modestobacter sp. DSM 44400]